MTIEKRDAEEIAASVQEAGRLCQQALHAVKLHENLGLIKVFGRLTGDFLGHSYVHVLAPVWKAFPEMQPAEMRTPYVKPVVALSEASRAALTEFLAAANLSLSKIKELGLPPRTGLSPYAGVEELEATVAEVEAFLAQPWVRDPPHDAAPRLPKTPFSE
jgi:hypothetical protein